jgi:hypothetical protein
LQISAGKATDTLLPAEKDKQTELECGWLECNLKNSGSGNV